MTQWSFNVQNFFRVHLQSLLIFLFARWKEMIYLQEGYTKRLKDIINAYNCFLKNAVFSIKASNGQFIIALDGIICFSVRVCDNSLLVLKISFSGLFFLKQKRYKSFPMTGRYNCRFYQCFFFCKIMP